MEQDQSKVLLVEGVVVDAARVGLWVMPDNQSHGMLEDFLAAMADTAHPELMVESESAISIFTDATATPCAEAAPRVAREASLSNGAIQIPSTPCPA